jgi:conjugative transposon TraJ protein
MNDVLSPTVTGTTALLDNTNQSVEALIAKRKQQLDTSQAYQMYESNNGEGNKQLWELYTQGGTDKGDFFGIGNDIKFALAKAYYNLKNWFKDLLSMLLEILYEAAALCINTIRTFNLLIMALIGPIVFGLAVFDGFQHTLTVYLARYVNFYLWLPIANILGSLLGKIQEQMINLDIQQIKQYGDSFFTTSDIGYIVFMLIGIVAYFTIPNLSNLVVNTGAGSALTAKVSNMSAAAVGMGVAVATGGANAGAGMAADAFGNANTLMTQGTSGAGTASGYFKDKLSG